MPTVIRNDPYPGHNFQVIVTGVSDDGSAVSGAFSEISGLEVEIKAIEYRNGNERHHGPQDPGLTTYTNLTCKRGATGHVEFWNWIKKALDGQVQRAEGSIILQDENQAEVMRWNFSRGWPCKYTGPTFNAANNEIAMETVEICVEELYLDVVTMSTHDPARLPRRQRGASLLARKGCATTSRLSSDRPCAARSACRCGCRDGRRSSRRSAAGNRARVPRAVRGVLRERRRGRVGRAGGARRARRRPKCVGLAPEDPANGPARLALPGSGAAIHRDQPRSVGQRHQGAAHLPRLRVRRRGRARHHDRHAWRAATFRRAGLTAEELVAAVAATGHGHRRRSAVRRRASRRRPATRALPLLGGMSCSTAATEPALDEAALRTAIDGAGRDRGDRARVRAGLR